MRLTPIEQQIIREASLRWFGVRPRLFGSRLDDLKRGGDINSHVKALVSPQQGVEARLHRVADIRKALDERKIDGVVNAGGRPLPIFEVAQRKGILL